MLTWTFFCGQVVGEFDYVSAYNASGVLTTVYTPVGKAEQVNLGWTLARG